MRARTQRGIRATCAGMPRGSGLGATGILPRDCWAAVIAVSVVVGCGGTDRRFGEDEGGAGSSEQAGGGSDQTGGGSDQTGDRAGGASVALGGSGPAGTGPDSPGDSGGAGHGGGGGALGDAGRPATAPRCEVDVDCPELETQPAGCAVAECVSDVCVYSAVDADGDGYATSRCSATRSDIAVEIALGRDCEDENDEVHPGAWDGPADDEHPDACDDSLDNDCSGVLDDGELEDGTRCLCEEGDTAPCAQTSSGLDIVYPSLDEAGFPLGNCRLGTRTCNARGAWSACVGAVGPSPEVCDRADNDCNGVADDDASDVRTFWYDADGDFHAPMWAFSVVGCYAPATAPPECAGEQALCPVAAWTTTPIAADDCDDTNANRYPGASEVCNRIDDDCSNTDGSSVEPLEDQDEDGFTSKTYVGCSGGFPRTDCFDLDANVRPDQTGRFSIGYCLNDSTPFWCHTERRCAAIDTCAESIGQAWGEGSVDYNCDGVEEPFSVSGTDTIPYAEACASSSTTACEGPSTPPYALSANADCGAISQHMQCRTNSGGTACAYQSTFLMTACR